MLRSDGTAAAGGFMPVGVSDKLLYQANEAVNAAIQGAGRQASGKVTINVTNVAHQYNENKPGYGSTPLPDVGD